MKENFNFEEAISRIREIADNMQENEISLEESLNHFEEGSRLIIQCRDYLEKAELRVKKILDKNSPGLQQDFD